MAGTTAGSSIVLTTRDRVLGEALTVACRPLGLMIHVVEPAVTGSGLGAGDVLDLDDIDPNISVQRFVAAVLDGDVRLRRRDAPASSADGLTTRERQICKAMAEGRSRADVASDLGISEHTVRTHLQNTFAKLGVRNLAELVVWTLNAGLVEAGSGA